VNRCPRPIEGERLTQTGALHYPLRDLDLRVHLRNEIRTNPGCGQAPPIALRTGLLDCLAGAVLVGLVLVVATLLLPAAARLRLVRTIFPGRQRRSLTLGASFRANSAPPGLPGQSRSVIVVPEPTSSRGKPLADGGLDAYRLGCLLDPEAGWPTWVARHEERRISQRRSSGELLGGLLGRSGGAGDGVPHVADGRPYPERQRDLHDAVDDQPDTEHEGQGDQRRARVCTGSSTSTRSTPESSIRRGPTRRPGRRRRGGGRAQYAQAVAALAMRSRSEPYVRVPAGSRVVCARRQTRTLAESVEPIPRGSGDDSGR